MYIIKNISDCNRKYLRSRKYLFFVLLIGVLILVFLLDIALGSVPIPIGDVVKVLFGGDAQKVSWTNIIFQFRLPKAVTAMLAGAALGVSGLQMQTIFRNPLAGPFVLGISSGASLGVALVVLTANFVGAGTVFQTLGVFGDLSLALASSLGAAAVLGLVLLVSRRVQDTITLLILGLLFGYGTSALVSILLQFSNSQQIQTYLQWTFGSFAGVTWKQMPVLAGVVLLGLVVAAVLSKPLNVLLVGDSYALTLGLNLKRTRFWVITSASILAGVITAFCGPIAFLGVAVPHLCRSMFNSCDHHILVPAVMIMGAILALFADLLCMSPGNQMTLPLNSVTALIGTPVVSWVILRRYYAN
ncbi:transport system permease protein [Calothrix sp. NIES-4101]|nr:transport system permease protein [Calothrix sp. NIES-4101]